MREIKFRVWCKNKNEWEKDACSISLDGNVCDLKRNMELAPETHILQQYAGLKDKNGKEIFEGDIVKHRLCSDTIATGEIIIEISRGVVVKNMPLGFDAEIIGNIYENPELLKDQK